MSAAGNSQVFITGGTFTGEDQAVETAATAEIDDGNFSSPGVGVRSHGSGSLTVRGGIFHGDADGGRSIDSSTVTVSGGQFSGSQEGLLVAENAKAVLRGGTFSGEAEDGLYASGNAMVEIFGGSFTGGFSDIYLDGSAVVRIHGYGFNLPLGSMANSSVTLTGTYFDGTPFVHVIDVNDASELELVSGYDAWAAFHGLDGDDALPTADKNGNGIPNAVELVFGGNPATGGATQAIETSSARQDHGAGEQEYLKITHPVTELSAELDVVSLVEYGESLAPGDWTAAQNGVAGVVVVTTPDAFAPGVHKTETWIPKSLAMDGRLFARVSADGP